MMDGWYDGAGWWAMVAVNLLFWSLVVGAIAWGVYAWTHRRPAETDGARAILAERFARGEIDEEEYRRRGQALG